MEVVEETYAVEILRMEVTEEHPMVVRRQLSLAVVLHYLEVV